MKTQLGFSMLEMFIAIWLGAILTANLITVFIVFYHDISSQTELAEIEERGHFITYFLTKQIHLAGDASCMKNQLVNQDKAIGGDVLQLGECIAYHDRLQFMQTQYYVADTGRKNNKGQPIYSLFMKTLGSEREELVEGVKDLQVHYGISLPGQQSINAYVSANQITNWRLVRSVDIALIFAPSNKVWHIYTALRERI
jgi:type IV pilus assembly protein PilW